MNGQQEGYEMITWRKRTQEQPQDEQECLTISKHGIIQGTYTAAEGTFSRYFWTDLTWHADLWVPIEEVRP
jgi:hypothetical protein